MRRGPGIYLKTLHGPWDFASAPGVAFSASDQAISSDFCLLGTTAFSFLRLLGVLHLYINLVPKRQKNLTCPEHRDIVISIKVVTTKPPALCLWLEEAQELGREKTLSISQQVGAQMKK